MLHGLVPTMGSGSRSSADEASLALPAPQAEDDSLGADIAGKQHKHGGHSGTMPAGETKKRKGLTGKLDNKMKLGYEKLDDLAVLQDDVSKSSALCPVCIKLQRKELKPTLSLVAR